MAMRHWMLLMFLTAGLGAQIPSLAPYREGKLWGYKGTRGQVVITPRFADAGPFQDGCAAVRSLYPVAGGGWGLVNGAGEWVLQPAQDNMYDVNQGAVLAQTGGSWGLLGTNGVWRLSPRFHDVWPFTEGLARVEAFGRWGFIDTAGKLVIDCVFEDPWFFNETLVEVEVKAVPGGVLRPEAGGRFRIWKPEIGLSHTGYFSEGLALVKEGHRILVIDRNHRLTNFIAK